MSGEAATGAQAQEARRSEAPTGTKERARLVARASEALWHVVVQRELMRLPGTERFIREMAVPREVVLGLGVMRGRSAPGGPRR